MNWAQVAVLIGAAGYFIKVILDYFIKKKEIKFTFLYKEKAIAFKDFLLSYQNFNNTLTTETFRYFYNTINFNEFESILHETREDLRDKIYFAYMYCSKKEKDLLFSILNNSTLIIYEIKKCESVESIHEILANSDKKTHLAIDNLLKIYEL